VFAIAIESGARYDNPALAAQRFKQRTHKRLELPESGQFERGGRECARMSKGAAPLHHSLPAG
jgi:hypothetical protein